MEIKIQVTLKDKAAERFVASMKRNHRTMAGEAAFRLEQSLECDGENEKAAERIAS